MWDKERLMSDPEEPKSPCNQKCVLEMDSMVCRSCLRTMQEIIDWNRYSAGRRNAIIERIAKAKAATAPRQGSHDS